MSLYTNYNVIIHVMPVKYGKNKFTKNLPTGAMRCFPLLTYTRF